jgi:hypothetical protein
MIAFAKPSGNANGTGVPVPNMPKVTLGKPRDFKLLSVATDLNPLRIRDFLLSLFVA